MNTLRHLLPSLAAALLCSCSTHDNADPQTVTVDLIGNFQSADRGNLDDILTVESVIRPAFTDSTMLNYAEVRGISGNRIYIQEQNRLMVFDAADGSCISSFDHTGGGPGEYNLLCKAWMMPTTGGWTVNDLRTSRILGYRADGSYTGSAETAGLIGVAPCGDMQAALCSDADDTFVIRIYDSSLNAVDSINTGIRQNKFRGHFIFPLGSDAAIVENDTLFTISDDGVFAPALAFNTGDMKVPYFESFEQLQATRKNYLWYESMFTDGHVIIGYMADSKITFQIYRRDSGELIYSHTGPADDGIGINLTIDGKPEKVMPLGSVPDDSGSIFFSVMPGDDTPDDVNPVIVRCRF